MYCSYMYMASWKATCKMCLLSELHHRSCSELTPWGFPHFAPQWDSKSDWYPTNRGLSQCQSWTCPPATALSGEVLNYATSNHENEAQVDVAARDFWTHRQEGFFDAKVFNTFAKSKQKFALASCFTRHERQKRAYEQRVLEIENGSFTPLVLSTTSDMGRLASIFYSRLAKMLSEKRQQPFSTTMG